MSLSLALLCISIMLPSKKALLLAVLLYFCVSNKKRYFLCGFMLLFTYFLPFLTSYHIVWVDDVAYHTRVLGLNYTGQLKGNSHGEISSLLLLKDNLTSPQDKTAFFKFTEDAKVLKKIKFPSLKRQIYHKNPELYGAIYQPNQEGLIKSYALPFNGLLFVLQVIAERFRGEFKHRRHFIILYGLLFKRSQSWWQQCLKSFDFQLEMRAVCLLLLYRHAYQNPYFIFVFAYPLLQSLSFAYQKVNRKLFQGLMVLYCFGRYHVLFYLCYPLLKMYYGVRFICLLFALIYAPFYDLVAKTDLLLLGLMNHPISRRLCLYGKPSLIFIFAFLALKSLKKQLIYCACLALYLTYPPYASVTFIDVGQGDSTLITLPFNSRAYLFDTGRYFAKDKVIQAVHQQGLNQLDALIISHDDADHNENQDVLMNYFRIKKLYTEKQPMIDFMTVLLSDKTFVDANENSIILAFNFYGLTYLLTGDAYKKQEQLIMRQYPFLRVDILKLGHHGSHTSSDENFLKMVQPQYAIASSNPQIYNHPHPIVKKSLFKQNIQLLETGTLGNIKIISFPFIHIIKTSRGSFVIIKQGDRHA